MKKSLLSLITLIIISCGSANSQEAVNHLFAQRDSSLSMDIYYPDEISEKNPVIIFMFGGGFVAGSKSGERNVAFCRTLTNHGYITAAIDYRLGLKGAGKVGITHTKPLKEAIRMAVEDLYSATLFLLENAQELKIDPELIIICGSSAGAISVLQGDYELANRRDIASSMPANFRYAGVISLAGAIMSYDGKPKYRVHPPAPTMMLHGTDDKLVFYNKTQIFNFGVFGTNAITKQFEKYNYPYMTIRYRDMGHEIADVPMKANISEIVLFINEYVIEKRHLKTDIIIKDSALEPYMGKLTPAKLYK